MKFNGQIPGPTNDQAEVIYKILTDAIKTMAEQFAAAGIQPDHDAMVMALTASLADMVASVKSKPVRFGVMAGAIGLLRKLVAQKVEQQETMQ